MNHKIESIVIVGGGVTGWTAAATLANGLKQLNIAIKLLELPGESPQNAAESTPPSIGPYLDILGVPEQQLMAKTSATFSLGTLFQLTDPASAFFHPLGKIALPSDALGFEQELTKLRLSNREHRPYPAFFLATEAAKAGKFDKPVNNPSSIRSTLTYGLNLDLAGYSEYLKEYAQGLGVQSVQGEIQHLSNRPDNGYLEKLSLGDGSQLSADLWLDCSGRQGRLIQQHFGVDYEDWSKWLPCDSIHLSSQPHANKILHPQNTITQTEAGWRKTIPLQKHEVEYNFFNSAYPTEESKATQVSPEHKASTVSPGVRSTPWFRNCISLGAAACSTLGLNTSALEMAQGAAIRLLDYFPDKNCVLANTQEYNRLCLEEWKNLRDYETLLFAYPQKNASPFWQEAVPTDLPESLKHRLELFKERGRLAFYENDPTPAQRWVSLLLGLGFNPSHYDPLKDLYPGDHYLKTHRAMLSAIAKAVAQMPEHKRIIEHYCPEKN